MKIQLPKSGSAETKGHLIELTDIETDGKSIVIIGANGSGKTRMGHFIEQRIKKSHSVVRIAAHRALKIPTRATFLSSEQAERALRYGNAQATKESSQKYTNEGAATYLQDDYSHLISSLIAQENKRNSDYVNLSKANNLGENTKPKDSAIDIIINIWSQLLPHRFIKFDDGQVIAGTGTHLYNAKEMSDGERVVLYLIGHCLVAPPGAVIIIDEPELHLHRSLLSSLWNQIEAARQDCQIIYITHDLEFASSRPNSIKIWAKAHYAESGRLWDWQLVPDSEGLPEEMLLTVLGSRKPVLFTEGQQGGYEYSVFSKVYPNWTIMPCSNCEQVIDATQSFTNLKHLHGNECRGIIDRDYRDEHNVARLQAQGVLVLETQEIENLMLDEAVLTAVLEQAIGTGAMAGTVAEKLATIKTYLFGQLARDQEMLTTKRASWEIEKGLRRFGTADGALGLAALEQAVAATAALPVADIYQQIDQEFTRIIAEQDYPALLRIYNNKGLAKRIGQFFNFREPFPDYFKRLLSIQSNEALVQALRAACPVLPTVAATA